MNKRRVETCLTCFGDSNVSFCKFGYIDWFAYLDVMRDGLNFVCLRENLAERYDA